MNSLSSVKSFHNSKLFFSKSELTKILSCYSLGVSTGKWKDYSINFKRNEANFLIYKHSLASPDYILTKSKKNRKNQIIFKLNFVNKNKNDFKKIDDLLKILKRINFNII